MKRVLFAALAIASLASCEESRSNTQIYYQALTEIKGQTVLVSIVTNYGQRHGVKLQPGDSFTEGGQHYAIVK